MEPSWTHHPEITLTQPFGPGARIVFALAGFAVIVAALRAFSEGLPLSAFAVFVGLSSLGLAFVLLNAFGQSEAWTLTERALVLQRKSPWRLSTLRFCGRDVAATTIITRTERGADKKVTDMFCLVLVSKAGHSYQLPPLASLHKAQELETELRARLGMPSR